LAFSVIFNTVAGALVLT